MKIYCYKGKHWVEKNLFSPSELKKPSSKCCKECNRQRALDYEAGKRKERNEFYKMIF